MVPHGYGMYVGNPLHKSRSRWPHHTSRHLSVLFYKSHVCAAHMYSLLTYCTSRKAQESSLYFAAHAIVYGYTHAALCVLICLLSCSFYQSVGEIKLFSHAHCVYFNHEINRVNFQPELVDAGENNTECWYSCLIFEIS